MCKLLGTLDESGIFTQAIFYNVGSANTQGFSNPEKSMVNVCCRHARDMIILPETRVIKISADCKIMTNDLTLIYNNYNLTGIDIDDTKIA